MSKHRDLLAQVLNVLILKVMDIAIVAAKKIHFFPQKLDRSAKSVLCMRAPSPSTSREKKKGGEENGPRAGTHPPGVRAGRACGPLCYIALKRERVCYIDYLLL